MVVELGCVSVEINKTVLDKLFCYEQTDGKNESGGILLGGFKEKEKQYVISDISEPSTRDKSGLNFFIRDKKKAQRIIDKKWKKSDGIINYLGEWHTHNSYKPYPSEIDKELLKQIIKDKSNCWEHIFMIIIGRKKEFYLGMASHNSNGKIILEKVLKGENE